MIQIKIFRRCFRACAAVLALFVAVTVSSLRAELPEHYDAPLHPCWGTEFPEYLSVDEIQKSPELWRDFAIQGEYTGTIDGQQAGLHLIAEGDGRFGFVLYPGGLPGDGWRVGTIRMFGKGHVEGEELVLLTERILSSDTVYPVQEIIKTTRYRFHIAPLEKEEYSGPKCTLELTQRGVVPLLKLEKVYRKSPTLGLAPPTGAAVIFDGTNIDQFDATSGDRAKVNRKRPDGVTLWAGATTKPVDRWWEKPMTFHVEFLNTYRPNCRGQARSNSGIFISETYELQILDSFGLESELGDCGALYSSKPVDVNVCFPPLVWQTFDVEFTPPKFEGDKKIANSVWTVKLNGIVIHDRYEMVKKTPADKEEIPEPRGIFFQPHENRVQFRNIWIQYN